MSFERFDALQIRVFHLTARSAHATPLAAAADSSRMWAMLTKAWPDALAICLMSNHLHVIVDGDPKALRIRLARICGRHASGQGRIWQPVPEPTAIAGLDKLRRQVRYVALNPCRAGLCADPLGWLWSTHLDVVLGRRADVLAALKTDLAAHHAYVSGDPSAAVDGTPLPNPAVLDGMSRFRLVDHGRAACVVTRSGPEALRRRGPARSLFLRLAHADGWKRTAPLMNITGMTRGGVSTAARLPGDTTEGALVLGDPRLLALYDQVHTARHGAARGDSGADISA
jgi:hypothetical protein